MGPFVRLDPDRADVSADTKVLQPEEYLAAIEAHELLENARQKAQEIEAKAVQMFEEERQRGYNQGLEEAQNEISERMIGIVANSVDYLATTEAEIAKTVGICLKKILGEMPEGDVVLAAASNALEVVRNEPRVTLIVRPDIQDEVRERVGELLKRYGNVSYIEISSDPGLPKGGCRLETEVGVVDASIEHQIEALQRAMEARLKGTDHG